MELKQFRVLAGSPVFAWSVDALVEAGCAPIVLVIPAGAEDSVGDLAEPVELVTGGATRQASVRNGLANVASSTVVIHDAARPLVTPRLIRQVVEAVDGLEGAVAALPVDETLKRVGDQRVVETVDRSDLWLVQTPQVFKTAVLRDAHRRAEREGFQATDDAQLVEHYGGSIAIVHGERTNLKLTYESDFRIAEALLRPSR